MEKEETYKKIFKYRAISLGCLYLGLFSVFLCVYSKFFFIVVILFEISYLVLSLKFWKCPVCGRGFTLRHGPMDRISHCPYCGEKLRDNNNYSDSYL